MAVQSTMGGSPLPLAVAVAVVGAGVAGKDRTRLKSVSSFADNVPLEIRSELPISRTSSTGRQVVGVSY